MEGKLIYDAIIEEEQEEINIRNNQLAKELIAEKMKEVKFSELRIKHIEEEIVSLKESLESEISIYNKRNEELEELKDKSVEELAELHTEEDPWVGKYITLWNSECLRGKVITRNTINTDIFFFNETVM